MNRLSIKVLALAVSLAFGAGAMAQGMSKDEYQNGKERIAAKYKADKAGCAALSGNANDICVAEAKGGEKIGRANLDDSYQPTRKTQYQARVATAEAQFAVANERCDDLAGNAKDVCVKEAKAVQTAAKAEAKAQMTTSSANDVANEKSSAARSDAHDKAATASKEAAADTLDARYGVAKEKCDVYAGEAKDHCLDRAKALFGKS